MGWTDALFDSRRLRDAGLLVGLEDVWLGVPLACFVAVVACLWSQLSAARAAPVATSVDERVAYWQSLVGKFQSRIDELETLREMDRTQLECQQAGWRREVEERELRLEALSSRISNLLGYDVAALPDDDFRQLFKENKDASQLLRIERVSGLRGGGVTVVQRRRRELGELAEKAEQQCILCCAAQITIAFVPCGHCLCCRDCAGRVEACPVCRRDITIKLALIR